MISDFWNFRKDFFQISKYISRLQEGMDTIFTYIIFIQNRGILGEFYTEIRGYLGKIPQKGDLEVSTVEKGLYFPTN